MLHNDLEEWEKAHVNAITLKMIFLATGGTLLATAVAFVLRKTALGEIQPELLFVPWGIVLVLGISAAFKKGVEEERARQVAVAKAAAKTTTPAKKKTRKKTTRKKAVKSTTAAKSTTTAKKTTAKKTTAKKAAPKKTGTTKRKTTAKKKTTTKKTTKK